MPDITPKDKRSARHFIESMLKKHLLARFPWKKSPDAAELRMRLVWQEVRFQPKMIVCV